MFKRYKLYPDQMLRVDVVQALREEGYDVLRAVQVHFCATNVLSASRFGSGLTTLRVSNQTFQPSHCKRALLRSHRHRSSASSHPVWR